MYILSCVSLAYLTTFTKLAYFAWMFLTWHFNYIHADMCDFSGNISSN